MFLTIKMEENTTLPRPESPINLKELMMKNNEPNVTTPQKSSPKPINKSKNPLIPQIESLWSEFMVEYLEIGMDDSEIEAFESKLTKEVVNTASKFLSMLRTEKKDLEKECITLQMEIFKMLRVFLESGYRPSPESLSIGEETYTEINQIFTKENEFNEIMKAIPDKYTKEYLLRPISPPYSDTNAYFLLVANILAKEYLSRLFKLLETVLLLKELAYETDFYATSDPASIAFSNALPNIEQCKTCLHQLEKVPDDSEARFQVVRSLLRAGQFNNLSKSFLSRIENQIELVEIKRNNTIEQVILRANSVIELWKSLYGYEDDDQSGRYDSKIVKCADGDTSELGLRSKGIQYLNEVYEKLLAEKEKRIEIIKNYIAEAKSLFIRLKEPEGRASSFEQRYNDYDDVSDQKLESMEKEITELREKKSKFMQDIVDFVKADIASLWSKMFFPEEMKSSVPYYYSDVYSDEALDSLEAKLKELQDLYTRFEPLFDKISQFNVLLSDKQALEEASRNPSRLMSRNSSAILLQEERLRKSIKSRFPKICTDLEALLLDYDKSTANISKTSAFTDLLGRAREEIAILSGKRASKISPVKKQMNGKSPEKNDSPTKHVSPAKRLSPFKRNTLRSMKPMPQPERSPKYRSKSPNGQMNRSPKFPGREKVSPMKSYPKLTMTEKSNLRINKSPSVQYSKPLSPLKIRLRLTSAEIKHGPDNIFLMGDNKENLPTKRSFGEMDDKEEPEPQTQSASPKAKEISFFDLSQDDTVYKNWKAKRLRNLKSSGLSHSVLPEDL